jgi:hypothetical protein
MRKASLFALFFLSSIHLIYGQVGSNILDEQLSIAYTEIRSDKAVKLISNKLGYSFSYDATLLRKRLVYLDSNSSTLRKLLYSIFEDSTINIAVHKRQILIYRNQFIQQKNPCDDGFLFTGKILDERLFEPVPYAAIKIDQYNQHTVANEDGIFAFNIPCKVDKLKVEIYALGYSKESQVVNVSNEPLNIFLPPTIISLQEVIIRSVEPEIVINKCLELIQENYTESPTNGVAFFRETVHKNDSLVGVSEAIFELYKEPYLSSKKDKLKLLKGRKFINRSQLDTVDFKLKGSLNSCLMLDVVKNLPSFLASGNFDIYDYKFDDILNYNDKLVYKIDFAPKEGIREFYYQGSLYIDEGNYALHAVEFQIDPSLLYLARSEMVFKKSNRLRTKPLRATYSIQYQEVGARLTLSYVRMDLDMRVRQRGKLFGARYTSSAEMVINKVDVNNSVQINRQEVFSLDKIFLDQPMVFDLNFWKGFDFLPLDKPLLQAVHALEELLNKY